MSDNDACANPILVRCKRGEAVESFHRGAAVIADSAGRVVRMWGDCERPCLMNSALKFIQTIPFVESGAVDAFGLGDAEIVLACSSHVGEDLHVELIDRWLKRVGLASSALKCGSHEPFSRSAARRLVRHGNSITPLHNNNSGKHAAFLTTALHLGAAIASYLSDDHPVQLGVLSAIERFTDVGRARMPRAIERCGMPGTALCLRSVAMGMARLGNGMRVGADAAAAASRILRAVRTKPELLVGPRKFSTGLCQLTRGRIVAKGGAEGVFVACLPESGLGVAVKIDDGAARGAELALLGVLTSSGLLTLDEASRAQALSFRAILDAHHRNIGTAEWVAGDVARVSNAGASREYVDVTERCDVNRRTQNSVKQVGVPWL